MSRRPNRPFLAVLLLLLASFARAESLRLVAPADGATLRGGTFAELRWSAGQLPAHSEEWEAFLSVDGGKYYAFRVTPHLDIDIQRFTFVVPNVDTHDARILIRTGDETRETRFEARGTFSIVRDPEADEIVPRLLHQGHGEAAREGDPAVVSWADGARDGSGLTQHVSRSVPARSLHRRASVPGDAAPALPAPAAHVHQTPTAQLARLIDADRRAPDAAPPARSLDLLLVCRRRNI